MAGQAQVHATLESTDRPGALHAPKDIPTWEVGRCSVARGAIVSAKKEAAKCLVGYVPTRANGGTSWTLSRAETRRNCSTCEDTGYARQHGKTPWSFTTTWHWIGA